MSAPRARNLVSLSPLSLSLARGRRGAGSGEGRGGEGSRLEVDIVVRLEVDRLEVDRLEVVRLEVDIGERCWSEHIWRAKWGGEGLAASMEGRGLRARAWREGEEGGWV